MTKPNQYPMAKHPRGKKYLQRRKTELVGRRYIADEIERLTDHRYSPDAMNHFIKQLQVELPTYYTPNEAMLFGIDQALWRRDQCDPVIVFMCRKKGWIPEDSSTESTPDVDANATEE